MQYAMAFSGIEGGNMKRVPAILAIIIGILDAALAVGIVLLLVQPGGSGGESAAVISESFEDNSESYGMLPRHLPTQELSGQRREIRPRPPMNQYLR